MERLQILVNHHNEDVDTVRRFLSSLSTQTGVNFEVLILSDGGDGIPMEALQGYKFGISYAHGPHTGVCNTRNALLDRSDAPVVMFADVDDMFHADGLRSLMAAIEGADVACSPFLSEDKDGSTHVLENDTLHVHGKVFRRQFLMENEIRFPDMEYSGDMAFLWLAISLGRVKWVRDVFYTWKWNGSSITRAKPHFHVRAFGTTLRCYTLLGRDLIRRGRRDLLERLVCTTFATIYISVTGDGWNAYPRDLVTEANSAAEKCLREFWDVYRSASERLRRRCYDTMVEFLHAEGHTGSFEDMGRRLAAILSGVLIVGFGTVGGNLFKEFFSLSPSVYDKYKGLDERLLGLRPKVAFVCVDTPRTDECPCDTTEVRNAVLENDADVYVIKSTVPVGFTDSLREETGKRVVFSPEYYGGTQHCDHGRFDFDFTILGGEREDCAAVVQVLQGVYDGRHRFQMTDARTAELAKYMENSWIATKVSFCNQFMRVARQAGVCYEELRELFVMDPRVGPSHTYVYSDRPYWQSHCLDKDVPAIASQFDAPLLDAVISYNESCKLVV